MKKIVVLMSLVIYSTIALSSGSPVTSSLPVFTDSSVKAYVLMDVRTGDILTAKNSDERLPPASLTKLMTVYLVFKELAAGLIKLTDEVTISKKAWKTDGSRMFVQVGTKVLLEDLLEGAIIVSGNDATEAIAEYLAGTPEMFVQLMNQEAKTLGMNNTHFMDPTGLPHPNHYTSARDLAILSRALIRQYPQYYGYFGKKWMTYNHIKQPNRNRLLWRDSSIDGLKTGHTEAAGYCLSASAQQNNTRFVTIVLGAKTESARFNSTQALLRYGFRFFETHLFYAAYQPIQTVRVYGGQEKYLNIGSLSEVSVMLPKQPTVALNVEIKLNKKIKAPIKKGDPLGTIEIKREGTGIQTQPLVALADDPKGSVWRRLIDCWALWF